MTVAERMTWQAAREWDVAYADLLSPWRDHSLSHPRFAVWLVLRGPPYQQGLLKIAGFFGRHHTTIMTGIKKAERLMVENPDFAAKVARLRDPEGSGSEAGQVRKVTSMPIFCRDCRWCKYPNDMASPCFHDQASVPVPHVVTGNPTVPPIICQTMRAPGGPCGIEAQLFQAFAKPKAS